MNDKSALQRTASRLAGLFGIRFYNLYYCEKDLLSEIQDVDLPIELEINLATEEDLEAIIKRRGPKIQKEFDQAIKFGGFCYVALSDGNIAGHSWVNPDLIDLLGMKVAKLPDGGSYNYMSYVFPEYRGKKVFQNMIRAVYTRMKKERCAFTANLVDKSNAASISARRRFGVTFQNAQFLKIPGFRPIIVGKRFVMGGR